MTLGTSHFHMHRRITRRSRTLSSSRRVERRLRVSLQELSFDCGITTNDLGGAGVRMINDKTFGMWHAQLTCTVRGSARSSAGRFFQGAIAPPENGTRFLRRAVASYRSRFIISRFLLYGSLDWMGREWTSHTNEQIVLIFARWYRVLRRYLSRDNRPEAADSTVRNVSETLRNRSSRWLYIYESFNEFFSHGIEYLWNDTLRNSWCALVNLNCRFSPLYLLSFPLVFLFPFVFFFGRFIKRDSPHAMARCPWFCAASREWYNRWAKWALRSKLGIITTYYTQA